MRLALPTPLLTAATALCLAMAPEAQRPSSFAFQPIPGVQASQVSSRGKILFARTPTELFAFSAATRRWVTEPISAQEPAWFTNEWILTRRNTNGGTDWRAFGAQRGRFVAQRTSQQAFFVNEMSHRNEGLIALQDGNELHVFSGWTGEWQTLTTGPGASVTIGRDLLLCLDLQASTGPRAIAVRALDGLRVDQPLSASSPSTQPLVDISDGLAVLRDDDSLYAFSAYLDQWISTPAPANVSTPSMSRNTAVWTHPLGAIAVGAQSLRFEKVVDRPAGLAGGADHYAWFESQAGHVQVYSASLGNWTKVDGVTSPVQIADRSPCYAVFETQRGFECLSSRTGELTLVGSSLTSWVWRSTTLGVFVEPGGEQVVYSALTGEAARVPAGQSVREAQRSATLLLDSNAGALALDARTGTWRTAPVTATQQWVDNQSALFALADAQRLATFDPQRGVFRSHPRNGQPLDVQIWRTSMIAAQGSELIGFSALHGTLETFDRGLAPNEVRSSSELGCAIYADGVVGYSAVPDTTTPAQFPEFRRAIPAGSKPGLIIHGPPNSVAAAFAGLAAREPLLIPLGSTTPPGLQPALQPLWLEGPILPLPMSTNIDSDGVARAALRLPKNPALIGFELAFQSLVLPPQGDPYLSRPTLLRLH